MDRSIVVEICQVRVDWFEFQLHFQLYAEYYVPVLRVYESGIFASCYLLSVGINIMWTEQTRCKILFINSKVKIYMHKWRGCLTKKLYICFVLNKLDLSNDSSLFINRYIGTPFCTKLTYNVGGFNAYSDLFQTTNRL